MYTAFHRNGPAAGTTLTFGMIIQIFPNGSWFHAPAARVTRVSFRQE
jgi:hypothetical protein